LNIKDTTIRYYRKKLNLSQQDLAKLLNTTQTNISFIETKRQYPDTETAQRLADILKTTIGKLYTETELELMRSRENDY
jgi:transcriptional regulator with XRE-family HTH domain